MGRKNNKEKQYRAIRTNHTLLSIVLFSVLLLAMAAGIYLAADVSMEFMMNSKLISECESVTLMARTYDAEKDSEDKAREIIASLGRDFLILDEKENLVYCQGENTCTMKKRKLFIFSEEDCVDAYLDQNDKWLETYKDDKVAASFFRILQNSASRWGNYYDEHEQEVIEAHRREGEENLSQEEATARLMEFYQTHDSDFFAFPIWISVPLSDGRAFVGKGVLYYNVTEVIIIVAIVLGVLILLLILLGLIIVNVAVNGGRQKKVINTFLTDPVTKGHNWTWFALKLEPKLRGFRYAKMNITVVEIDFINFRNFCTCHSLEEGEKMLCKIHEVIRKSLTKREACAHVGTSSFAVLLEYETEEGLRKRLRNLIEELENIDSTHKFAFHVGVDLVETKKNDKGKVARRKDFSIEKAYNNACMARATLSDVEDSRIAFFDQKLVDEKLWIDAVTERQDRAVANEEFVVYYQP